MTWGCGPAPDGTGGLTGIVAGDQAEYQPLAAAETVQFNQGGTPKQVFWMKNHGDKLFATWDDDGYEARGFLYFDAQDVPSNATVELELYIGADPDSHFPLELTLSALDVAWDSALIPKSNAFLAWPKASAVATSSISSAKDGWVRFDITPTVDRWRRDPSSNLGLIVSGPTGTKSAAWVNLGGDTGPRLRLMTK
jgi:hypothetical protein